MKQYTGFLFLIKYGASFMNDPPAPILLRQGFGGQRLRRAKKTLISPYQSIQPFIVGEDGNVIRRMATSLAGAALC
jgi:hypothetical protein